jgi:hypothetical protein
LVLSLVFFVWFSKKAYPSTEKLENPFFIVQNSDGFN